MLSDAFTIGFMIRKFLFLLLTLRISYALVDHAPLDSCLRHYDSNTWLCMNFLLIKKSNEVLKAKTLWHFGFNVVALDSIEHMYLFIIQLFLHCIAVL